MSATHSADRPVAGETFRRAAALPLDGAKRRRLLCLLAAYADAGNPNPPVSWMRRRLGFDHRQIDALLRLLEHDGYLHVRWRAGPSRRNVYELRLDGQERR